MSYEDIEDARAKRAAKEQVTAGKGKCGRKRKSPAPEAGKAKKARRSEVEVADRRRRNGGLLLSSPS